MGLFFGSNLDHNLSRHGRSLGNDPGDGHLSGSFPKTAFAFPVLRECPIWLWSGLDTACQEFLRFVLDGTETMEALIRGLLAYAQVAEADHRKTAVSLESG